MEKSHIDTFSFAFLSPLPPPPQAFPYVNFGIFFNLCFFIEVQ